MNSMVVPDVDALEPSSDVQSDASSGLPPLETLSSTASSDADDIAVLADLDAFAHPLPPTAPPPISADLRRSGRLRPRGVWQSAVTPAASRGATRGLAQSWTAR